MDPISAQITRLLSVYKFQDKYAVKKPTIKVWKDVHKAHDDNRETDRLVKEREIYGYTK